MSSSVCYQGFYSKVFVDSDSLVVVYTDIATGGDLPPIRIPVAAVAAIRLYVPTALKLGQLRLFVGVVPVATDQLSTNAATRDPLTVTFDKKAVGDFTALATWLDQSIAYNQSVGTDPTGVPVDLPSTEDTDTARSELETVSTRLAVEKILGPGVREAVHAACVHTGSLFGWKQSLQAFANALTSDEVVELWLPGRFAGGAAILGLTTSRVLIVRSDLDRTKIDAVLRTPQLRAEWIERWNTGLIKIADPTRELKVSGLDKAGGRLFASHVIASPRPAAATEHGSSERDGTDPYTALARLGDLHDAGVLTDTEFEDAKSVLLRKL